MYALHEELPLYVNQDDPTDVIVDTVLDRWIAVLVLVTLGVGFIGIPLWISHFISRR